MGRRLSLLTGCCLLAFSFVAAFFSAQSAQAAAFGIFEQGTKAMGMAGAFTAQADDPSMLFHNAGGLAFIEESQLTAGFTHIHVNGTQFRGAAPFPGPTAQAEMEDLDQPVPHAYYLRPINDKIKFGIGINAPFGLATEWKDKDNFPGRFISTRAELTGIDVNPTLGFKVNDRFGIGIGIIARFSKVELERRIPTVNPFTQSVVDIGRIDLESDFDNGIGFNVGILHKPTSNFSWGLSYRSNIEIDFGGSGVFTQISTGNPQLDGIVAASLPFGQSLPLESTIDFPDMASLGFAFQLTRGLLAEVDINYTGWSSFDILPITFTTAPALSSQVPQEYDDAYNYRLGFNYETRKGSEWRYGVVFDETPQPPETAGPLLPDNDRNGFTLGYGTAGGRLDLALMYLLTDELTTTVSRDNFNGTYETDAVLFGATVNF